MSDKPELRLVQTQSARDAVERGLNAYDELHAAHQDAAARADQFERMASIANAENDKLRRELKALKANRDHYMRAYAALKAQLSAYVQFAEAGSKILLEALHMAEVQAYEPVAEGRPTRREPALGAGYGKDMPSVVKQGPAT